MRLALGDGCPKPAALTILPKFPSSLFFGAETVPADAQKCWPRRGQWSSKGSWQDPLSSGEKPAPYHLLPALLETTAGSQQPPVAKHHHHTARIVRCLQQCLFFFAPSSSPKQNVFTMNFSPSSFGLKLNAIRGVEWFLCSQHSPHCQLAK